MSSTASRPRKSPLLPSLLATGLVARLCLALGAAALLWLAVAVVLGGEAW